MRKRFIVAPPVLAGLLYFFSHLYPWTRSCVIKAYPEVHADASAPMGVSSPSVVGPRRPGARFLWCLGLSLDRLNPTAPASPSHGQGLSSGPGVSVVCDGSGLYQNRVATGDRSADQGVKLP
jgi:hypothetical protein